MTKKAIYLDYAATTPMDRAVLLAMQPYFVKNFYNPSASYMAAKAVKRDLSEARAAVARHLGARPAEIIFTAGATEANNLAIQGVMKLFPAGEVLISSVEHESVRTPAWLFDCREMPVTKTGLVEPSTVSKMISDKTVLISIGLVNNELGTLQPLKEISVAVAAVREHRKKSGNELPIYLHTDAAQAGCYFGLNSSRLGVDMTSINGGKIYGPKQSGALFVRSNVKISPIIGGGGQEWGMRAGTENVPGIIGLSAALEAAQARRSPEARRVTELRKFFIDELSTATTKLRINGPDKRLAPHIVSVTVPGTDNERLMMELDELGVQCATGSACSASSREPSHVLTAIGLDAGLARSTLRFSFGRYTTKHDVLIAGAKFRKIIGSNR